MSAAGERQAGEAGRSFALSLAAIAAAAVAVILAAAALWAVHPSGSGGGGSAERADQDVQHRARRPVGVAVIDLGYLRDHGRAAGGQQGGDEARPATGRRKHVYRDAVPRHEPDSQPRAFGSTQQAWCTVPGHKTAGMILTAKVTGSAAAAPSPSASMPAPRGGTASSADAAINSDSTPTAGWKPLNASLAAAAATVRHVILVAENNQAVPLAATGTVTDRRRRRPVGRGPLA